MSRAVSIQDIAKELNVSRNTVSKVLNNKDGVAPETRDLILAKAKELNYKTMGELQQNPEPRLSGFFVLLAAESLGDSPYWGRVIKGIENAVSAEGGHLLVSTVSHAQLKNGTLPGILSDESVRGLITMELYYPDYLKKIAALNVPVVSMDNVVHFDELDFTWDIVLPESCHSVQEIVSRILQAGAVRPGFVGDPDYCMSFNERYWGFRQALWTHGVDMDRRYSILEPNAQPYGDIDWMYERLLAMPALPDALVCANDFIAYSVLRALYRMGVSVPDQVKVSGFDNLKEPNSYNATLSTVAVDQ